MFGSFFPGRFASRSFFFLFLLRVPLINTDRSMRTRIGIRTFCFCLKISASLRRANDVCYVVPIAIQEKTYASFLFANEAPLSLGFFCPAALFCAFWRSCSR